MLPAGAVAPASVTFTNADWSAPQTVTVTGADDLLEDGDVPYVITTAPAGSTDPLYGGVDATDVAVVNLDNDLSPDSLMSTVTAIPAIVLADGIATSVLTATIRDANGTPRPGYSVIFTTDRGAADVITQPSAPTDAAGVAVGAIRSSTIGLATVTASVPASGIAVAAHPTVTFALGTAMQLAKTANRNRATLGEVVTYTVTLASTSAQSIPSVFVEDVLPAPFRYLQGSATRDGVPIADPTSGASLTFDLGSVPGLVDGNGNGVADPGEPGFVTMTYRAVIGSGATPGTYTNLAFAREACTGCAISNTAAARVDVVVEPVFSLGTVLGRVFEDVDEDGLQARNERGIGGARVALDDGTVAITDGSGNYHMASVTPGHRLIKIDLQSVPGSARATGPESQFLTVTSGMLAKANFPVAIDGDSVEVGSPAIPGLEIAAETLVDTVDVRGNTNDASVLVNGRRVALRAGDARLSSSGLEERVTLEGGKLEKPITFHVQVPDLETLSGWTLTVFDDQGHSVHQIDGKKGPPAKIVWDGRMSDGKLIEGGAVYRYQLAVTGGGRTRLTSPMRAFGVERRDAVAISITGDAFDTGGAALGRVARQALHGIAEWLRKHEGERIVIEGHTDSVGSAKANEMLSLERARAAGEYLVSEERIARGRIEVKGYGEERPIASNDTPEGREKNRRVEVRARGMETRETRVRHYDRIQPTVVVNDSVLQVSPDGRFVRRIDGNELQAISVSITDPHGRVSESHSSLPELTILEPRGEIRLAFGAEKDGYRTRLSGGPGGTGSAVASAEPAGGREVVAECRLVGRTDPANTVEVNGVPLAVGTDSTFAANLSLRAGDNAFGLVVRNSEGLARLVTLPVHVADAGTDGRPLIVVDPIPNLRVKLPPKGQKLTTGAYRVSGTTDPGNTVTVNGHILNVAADGSFVGTVPLPAGKSHVVIEATDSLGRAARIEREAEVGTQRMFLVAIADGAVGQLEGQGMMRDAVDGGDDGLYVEGRVAYYLKGVVRGRYLVTSAYDSGIDEFAPFFDRVDPVTNDRLLTNLDPNRYYPVYGDSSIAEYDAQSRGRFYLAVESEELLATVGAAALSLEGGELGSFQRTLDGARVHYQALSRTRFGAPKTQVTVIGAEARLAHVRDELRGTGGSLYYLSHKDLVEGGEQITLAIRDRQTGLVRLRVPQRRGADYTIYYPEGRLLFARPVSSVAEAGTIVSHDPLAGDPVIIEVEYEARTADDTRSMVGGRVRQQVGDHVAVGGMAVRDELQSQPYELGTVDAELRLSERSKVTGELATSTGSGATAHFSDDGGLSFVEQTPLGALEGEAWRAAFDLDAGEWFRQPGAVRVRGYLKQVDRDFVSSGNLADRGTEKGGVGAEVGLANYGRLAFRFDAERRRDSIATVAAAGRSQFLALQWQRDAERWGLATEMQMRNAEDGAGRTLDSSSAIAGRLWTRLNSRLTTHLEQQLSLRGVRDDRTTLGVQYQLNSRLALGAEGSAGTRGVSAQGRAAVTWGAGSFYVAERYQQESAGAHATTVVGAQMPIGPSSRVYSEYQWRSAGDGPRDLMLVGAQKQLQPASSLVLTFGGEHAVTDAEPERTRRSALTGSATWATPSGVRLDSRNEVRFEYGAMDRVQVLTANQIEARLVGGLTVLGHWRWSETRDRETDRVEARIEEHGLGLAMRPQGSGPVGLARFTRVGDVRPTAVGGGLPTSYMDVYAIEGSTAIGPRFEWTTKGAHRVFTDGAPDSAAPRTHSLLVVNRLNAKISGPFGFGVEYRLLTQRESGDRRNGWLNELTWDPAQRLRVGAGYNFAEFSDNEFSRNDSSVRGWFLRLQGRY